MPETKFDGMKAFQAMIHPVGGVATERHPLMAGAMTAMNTTVSPANTVSAAAPNATFFVTNAAKKDAIPANRLENNPASKGICRYPFMPVTTMPNAANATAIENNQVVICLISADLPQMSMLPLAAMDVTPN